MKRFLAILLCVASASIVHAQTTSAEHLVWSDEFSGPSAAPDPSNWNFETGGNGWGNHELETYCAPGSAKAPCKAEQHNAIVEGGYLHITARRDAVTGKWTSARMTTKGLQSFQYGRIEARIKIPAGAGVWPAFWMLGDDIDKRPWPACGELDIMENIGKEPTKIHGSVHGTGFTGTLLSTITQLASGEEFAAAFHTYGMIWSPGEVQYTWTIRRIRMRPTRALICLRVLCGPSTMGDTSSSSTWRWAAIGPDHQLRQRLPLRRCWWIMSAFTRTSSLV